jgi:hypothetical protein
MIISRELFHFEPEGNIPWSISHATQPIVYPLSNNSVRIFFSTRDIQQRNRLGFIDVFISGDVIELLNVSGLPSLDIGESGHFDCDGVYGASIVETNGVLKLFYAGWNAGKEGMFFSAIGSATSLDLGLSFHRDSPAPLLGRDQIDPWSCMAPFVLKTDEGLRMWYVSGVSIQKNNSLGLQSKYDIKTADSNDGLTWIKTGVSAIPLLGDCTNIARSVITKMADSYQAWYSYIEKSSAGYKLGVATSKDGHFFSTDHAREVKWSGKGLPPSWMTKDQCYPFNFFVDGIEYLAVSGDQFGKSGFGIFKTSTE